MCWFHATRNDLDPGIKRMEDQYKLKYIAETIHGNPFKDTYYSALDIPNLGRFQRGHRDGRMCYLVGLADCYLVAEEQRWPQTEWDYSIDSDDNSECFSFTPGGVKEDGSIAPGSFTPTTLIPSIRELCATYGNLLTKGFAAITDNKKNTWYVGPEALEILRSGMDLYTLMGCDPLTLPKKYT